MAFLELHGLCKHYGQSVALHPATIAVEQGQFLCLLGPSGCGKTTLLNCIAGITDITDGSVLLDGRDITRLKPELRRCGMVFQSYALFPNLSVAGNIAYGLRGPQWPGDAQRRRVAEMLELVGLSGYEHRRPVQLSGGQQQRVALARALAPSPDILLLDEPLSALDAQVRVRLGEELRHLQRELGITTVMVTHDQQEALALADRIVVMNHGRIEQQGTPEEIWRAPANLFVARFVGGMNLLHLPGCDGEMCGIRHEDVRVLEATDFTLKVPRTWTARVESVQYMGRCVRLSLLLQDYATRLYADMPPAEQHFAVRDLVAVHLPEEACRYWPDATAAGEALP